MAQELKRAVDDGRVRDAVAQAEVPDLWMKHVQLSINRKCCETTGVV